MKTMFPEKQKKVKNVSLEYLKKIFCFMAAVYGEHSVCMQIISKTYRYVATIKGSEADNLPDVLQQLAIFVACKFEVACCALRLIMVIELSGVNYDIK